MRAVVATSKGVLELNWLWLPTWMGMNGPLREQLGKYLEPKLAGLAITEENLDYAHEEVLKFLVKEARGLEGVYDYLDGLKFVRQTTETTHQGVPSD
jgi:hypothetical protein